MESTSHQDYGHFKLQPETTLTPSTRLAHGQRRMGRPNGSRQSKTVHDYVAAHNEDLSSHTINRDGQLLEVLICQFCNVVVGARSDRIKEHLASRRHLKVKSTGIKTVPLITPEAELVALQSYGRGRNNPFPFGTQKQNGGYGSRDSLGSEKKTSSLPSRSTGQFVPILPMPHASYPGTEDVGWGPVPTSTPCFHIRWNNFDSNMKDTFKKYLDMAEFSDVTLWVEEKPIKCHKLVLSSGSGTFENLLKVSVNGIQDSSQVAIIPLPGLRFSDVRAIVEFIYTGEFEVPKDDIGRILEVANSLKIKGLMGLDPSKISHGDKEEADVSVRERQDQSEAANTYMIKDEDVKTKEEIVQPNGSPEAGPVLGIKQTPYLRVDSRITGNKLMNMNVSGVTGNYQNNGYNYPYPLGVTYNEEGLSLGILGLMASYWGQQQLPTLPN